jgi:glycosyltransferase involved in cell wall biosynthesis
VRAIIVSDYAEINGGAAKVAIVSARALAQQGVDVTFLCAVGTPAPELRHDRIELIHLNETDVWNVGSRFKAAAQAIWNENVRRKVAEVLAERRGPDTVVHVHQWTKAFSPGIFSALGAIPAVVTLHDYFYVCPTGLLYDFQKQEVCERVPMSVGCLTCHCDSRARSDKAIRVVRQVSTRIALRTLRPHAMGVIHVSHAAREAVAHLLPAGVRQFTVPNPCVVTDRRQIDVSRNRSFVYIGRFQPEKGVLDFAAAAAKAGVDAVFLGEGALAGSLKSVCPSAEILPWGDLDRVQAVLETARCVVLPSRWRETFGLSVLEAQAVGVPAIVSSHCGASDIVRQSRGGLIVKPKDIAGLADALSYLARNDNAVAAMGERAFQGYDSEAWSEGSYARRLIDCYRTLLGSDKAVGEFEPRGEDVA